MAGRLSCWQEARRCGARTCGRNMPADDHDPAARDRLTATWIELAIRLAVLGLLLYFAFILIRPFITIAIWSVVLTVALYPGYDRMVGWLGGRRRLAAVLLTILGPADPARAGDMAGAQPDRRHWQPVGAARSRRTSRCRRRPRSVKDWPLIGEPIYQFWELASTNLQAALAKIAPQLRPVGSSLLDIAADAGTGAIQFLIGLIVAGFLFPPAPALVDAMKRFSRRLASQKGETFVQIAGATIRAVARGVIGVAALQAFLIGIGLVIAGIPGASLLTLASLVLGIIQIGPSLVVIPVIIWVWTAMDTTTALLFTAYMIPVNLIDNVLRPLVMGRGLDTPIVVILIGVIGGTISLGLTGLFLGPIILAVIWELLVAWIRERANSACGIARAHVRLAWALPEGRGPMKPIDRIKSVPRRADRAAARLPCPSGDRLHRAPHLRHRGAAARGARHRGASRRRQDRRGRRAARGQWPGSIGLRADMDALPILEANDVPYKSTQAGRDACLRA